MRAANLTVALMLISCSTGYQCFAGERGPSPTIALKPLKVVNDFKGKDDEPAADISGIACLAPAAGRRTCLLVNDENRSAQFATLERDVLTVGETVS
jgi:hypothetical protein